MDNIYRYSVQLIDGETFPLKLLTGRTVLFVNIASKCSFSSQLATLEKLYQKYRSKGFEIIAFPCNQFGKNEPLEGEMLREYYRSQAKVSFPLCQKVLVNGPDAHPLFNYLKAHTRGIAQNRAIKWNFTKFLVNSEGQLVSRYAPRTKPESLHCAIEGLLENENRSVQFAKL
ncbi:glutathione peroxidase [Pseudoalteromonas xiamenensis]|uniref:Glutathione peroxidase n=1 Tax=Pseudoalteromonas xiamenensis TaxID=882626 RepID=A0A975HLD7_9GAMM|nr:glutathione peroxidase [Pseudoalteromonas xiamenensis]QTH71832.1 glutathione peroxidase [Pseudoalteromonas xiamenensis]WMN60252.1 glutathione peroxidase [Pseudoalteromonas xiamenensis]